MLIVACIVSYLFISLFIGLIIQSLFLKDDTNAVLVFFAGMFFPFSLSVIFTVKLVKQIKS